MNACGVSAGDFDFQECALDGVQGVELRWSVDATVEPALAFGRRIKKQPVRGVTDERIRVTFECSGKGDVNPQLLPVSNAATDAIVLQNSGTYDEKAALRTLGFLEPPCSAHRVEDEPVWGAVFAVDAIAESLAGVAGDDNCLAPESWLDEAHTVEYYMPMRGEQSESIGTLTENRLMDARAVFESEGYFVASSMFSAAEIENFKAHYESIRLLQKFSDVNVADPASDDPLKRFPRQMQMHREDPVSLDFLCDARIDAAITGLTGYSPLAVQTMFYFKPPTARGQALHQDNFYLKAAPSTCIAAWLAVDDCDEENGCIMVVPGTHELPTMCLSKSDTTKSFTSVEVAIPEGMESVPVVMKAGDVLFFNGQVIHGSNPNTSATRFRRSLIAHYVIGDCTAVSQWYKPVYRMDQTIVELDESVGGGQCGDWVESGGELVVEMFDASDRDLLLLTE